MTTTATAPAVSLEETDALTLEALAPMPQDLIALREEKIAIQERIDALETRKKEIRDIFGQRLLDDGLQGYLLHGKVHARRTVVRSPRLDSKALKDKHPRIYAAFVKITESVRIVVD